MDRVNSLYDVFRILQDPVPQYVLGCLPAIASVGIAPDKGILRKLLWVCRCLGCPFIPLFYFCRVKNDPVAMCVYWLSADYFAYENGSPVEYRPVGYWAKQINPTKEQMKCMKQCMAEASVLDRLSSLGSVYYILFGAFTGIFRAVGPCLSADWPYLSLAVFWALIPIVMRMFHKKIVVKDPRKLLKGKGDEVPEDKILVSELSANEKFNINAYDALVAITSITIPWIAPIMAYFTRPVGFGCRSKYLSVLCCIWSFNSALAYLLHRVGERHVGGKIFFNCYFCVSGIIIAILLILLSFLSYSRNLWVVLFSETCAVSGSCSVTLEY